MKMIGKILFVFGALMLSAAAVYLAYVAYIGVRYSCEDPRIDYAPLAPMAVMGGLALATWGYSLIERE